MHQQRLKNIDEQEAKQKASNARITADTIAKDAIVKAKAVDIVAAAPRPPTTAPLPSVQAPVTVTNNNTFSFVLPGGTVDQFVRQNVVPVLDSITRRSV